VFKINAMHSNDRVLRHFCGVEAPLPIWGEVQHSLWETKNFRKHRESRLFPRLFTWNDIINFTNQVPIGDPYLYLKHELFSSEVELNQDIEKVLVIPKFRRNLSFSERIKAYAHLLDETQINFPSVRKSVIFHGEEDVSEIRKIMYLDPNLWRISDRRPQQTIREIKLQLKTLVQAEVLITDYLGVHLMRRLAISGQESILFENWKSWRGVDPEINEFLEVLISPSANVNDKVQASRTLLGEDFLRDRQELCGILGFTGVKKIIGPIIVDFYHRRVGSHINGNW
jgi:hypothetical protein